MVSRPTITCPGCGEQLYLHPMDGWRNDTSGFTCKPSSTVHTDHINLAEAIGMARAALDRAHNHGQRSR